MDSSAACPRLVAVLFVALLSAAAATPPAPAGPVRRAPTGHITNYDEAKVGTYILPPLLVLADGQPVRDAAAWYRERRPELLELYRRDIYGRVPATAPRVQFRVVEAGVGVLGGQAIRKVVAGHFGDRPDGPTVYVVMYLPARAVGPVPILLHLTFGGDPAVPASADPRFAALPARRAGPGELGPIADIIAHGYGYAVVRYTQIEPDAPLGAPRRGPDGRPDPALPPLVGVRTLALAPGQQRPAPDEWGAISAWAWGASRIVDYLETDPAVDPRRIALIGHSRLGKTVLWAGAQDPRFALVFSSCAGEMGSSLARRDYGETVDDMAANFPYQFAGNFQRYAGHWNDLPVDTHMVIALNAPHPLLITAGTLDQWADPRGEFLAEVAAGPVYRLVGRTGLGTTVMPPPDTPLLTGDLGFNDHTGPHAITASDWRDFLVFADKYLRPDDPAGAVAAKPLYRDPIYDGAADPTVEWNPGRRAWWMYYTNRRADAPGLDGVAWVHGTPIGIAASADGGATWRYVGTAAITLPAAIGSAHPTLWAPDVVRAPDGTHRLFLAVVPGIFPDWHHPRRIVELTSTDMLHWHSPQVLALASDRVIDPTICRLPDGTWGLWYNNERAAKSIWFADSPDLDHWTDHGKVIGDQPGEGPKVFPWRGSYWMLVDVWHGLAVYRSPDARHWTRAPGQNLVEQPGHGADDKVMGGHPDVVVSGGRAFLFYFTQPGRTDPVDRPDAYPLRRSSIQVTELHLNAAGWLACDRDLPTRIRLLPPVPSDGPGYHP